MRYYILLLLAVLFMGPVSAQNDTDGVIFKAMQDEMKRTQEQLVLPNSPKPFNVTYGLVRSRSFSISGALGGVSLSSVSDWQTLCASQLLLGDYQHTNDTRYGGPAPAVESASEIDYDMLRRGFWMVSDAAYKFALQEQAAKESYLKTNPLPADVANLPELQKMEPVEKIINRDEPFEIDQKKWENIVSEVSAIFSEYKDIYNSSVGVSGTEIEIYKLTSEGVKLKQPMSYVSFYASAYVMTEDGVKIADTYSLFGEDLQDLPSLEELKEGVRNFAEGLLKLKAAPVIDEYYSGPVLFAGGASSSIFIGNLLNQNGLFASRTAIGQKQPQTLENRINRKIIDNRLTVKNYTKLDKYNGVDLIGAYEIDADGVVPADEMTLVDHGILKMFLNGRIPTTMAPQSTGSSRFVPAGNGFLSLTAPGTIHIQVEDGLKSEKMKKALIKAAKEEGLSYAYVVRSVNGLASKIYKVDVKDGSETQVRFGTVSGIDLSKIKRLREISSKENVLNYILNRQVLSSLIYPDAVLVDDVEINEVEPSKEKAPALTFPLQRQ